MGHPHPERESGPYPANMPILEALVTLGYIAAVTERVGLGTEVLVLPQRQPVLTAKQFSTLDTLSGGRVRGRCGSGLAGVRVRGAGHGLRHARGGDGRGDRSDEGLLDRSVDRFRGRALRLEGDGNGTQAAADDRGRRHPRLDRRRLEGRLATRRTGRRWLDGLGSAGRCGGERHRHREARRRRPPGAIRRRLDSSASSPRRRARATPRRANTGRARPMSPPPPPPRGKPASAGPPSTSPESSSPAPAQSTP